jgi:hypothetical protein
VSGQNVQTLALANTFTYGGIGGTQATTSGGSPQGPPISTHELGHSLGQMADEYPYSSRDVVRPCYAGGEPGSFHHTIRTSVEDGDGWFNYFGFPEQPEGTPFTFSHSGKDVKALTYGNLGTGGLSKATFEQSFTDAHPSGGFEPGYGTHTIEHRAIDAAGNIGDADNFARPCCPAGPQPARAPSRAQSKGSWSRAA